MRSSDRLTCPWAWASSGTPRPMRQVKPAPRRTQRRRLRLRTGAVAWSRTYRAAGGENWREGKPVIIVYCLLSTVPGLGEQTEPILRIGTAITMVAPSNHNFIRSRLGRKLNDGIHA